MAASSSRGSPEEIVAAEKMLAEIAAAEANASSKGAKVKDTEDVEGHAELQADNSPTNTGSNQARLSPLSSRSTRGRDEGPFSENGPQPLDSEEAEADAGEEDEDLVVPSAQVCSPRRSCGTPNSDADPEDTFLATQGDVPDYLLALDTLEEQAGHEYAALKEKVNSATDPSCGARERLQGLAMEAWALAFQTDMDCAASEVGEKLSQLEPQDLEKFHGAWSKVVYDVKEVYQAIGFHKKAPQESLRSFMTSHCLGFFSDVLARKMPDPVKAQGDTSIRSICPDAIAEAVSRVSVGNGLPKDGHVLFSAFQGQCAFLWNGPAGELKNPPLDGTESEWNVAASTLPLIVAGESAAGKDNLKRVVLDWLHKLESAGRPATRALLQGPSVKRA